MTEMSRAVRRFGDSRGLFLIQPNKPFGLNASKVCSLMGAQSTFRIQHEAPAFVAGEDNPMPGRPPLRAVPLDRQQGSGRKLLPGAKRLFVSPSDDAARGQQFPYRFRVAPERRVINRNAQHRRRFFHCRIFLSRDRGHARNRATGAIFLNHSFHFPTTATGQSHDSDSRNTTRPSITLLPDDAFRVRVT